MLRKTLSGLALGATVWLAFLPHHAAATEGDRLDFKYMYYWDRNDVWNHSPVFSWVKSLTGAWKFRWNQEFDVVSGASRRLGLRNIGQQGDNNLNIDAISGATRREVRHSEQATASYADQGRSASASMYFSDESDYTSYSPAVSASWDFNKRNTTLGTGLAVFLDDLHPLGAFAPLGGSRRITSLFFTLAQTVTPLSLAGITLNAIHSTGVLGHPYNPVVLEGGNLVVENLPDAKVGLALTGQWIQGFHLGQRLGSVHFEARHYRDTWLQNSNTADIQWYQYLTEGTHVRLRARAYSQGKAAFARDSYRGDEVYRTADIRYYKFASLLMGVKLASVFPESWGASAVLPDRWDISYDSGPRDTPGDADGVNPFTRYQLFSSNAKYWQGTFMVGLGFNL